jgi:hypothetical protein
MFILKTQATVVSSVCVPVPIASQRNFHTTYLAPSTQQEMSFKRLDLGLQDFLKLFWVLHSEETFFYPKFYWNSITDLKRTTTLETLHLDELHTTDHIESRSWIRQTRCKHRVHHTQRSFGARLELCQFPDGIPSVDTMKHADSDRGTPKRAENYSHDQACDMSFHHYCFQLLALFWLHQMILSREHTS